MSGRTVLVVGASRGLGRGIAEALAAADARVIAVARTTPGPGSPLTFAAADATDEHAAAGLLERYRPDDLVLVAGATPELRPLSQHTWDSFSVNWHTDVRIAFVWLQAALTRPLPAGGRVVVVSSGAALQGSPLSGGYAGAKSTQRFLARYAQDESDRRGLDLTVRTVLPRLTPATDLGRPAVRAYAALAGVSEEAYVAGLGPPVTPAVAGAAVVDLLGGRCGPSPEFLLTGAGLQPVP